MPVAVVAVAGVETQEAAQAVQVAEALEESLTPEMAKTAQRILVEAVALALLPVSLVATAAPASSLFVGLLRQNLHLLHQ
jgi:hypothetical protein